MKKRIFSNNSNAFLLEIVLNILLFAVLLTVSMKLIMKAHTLTAQTKEEYKVTEFCQSLADSYEAGDGSLSCLSSTYPEASISENGFHMGLNQDMQPQTGDSDAVYTVTAIPVDASELAFHGQAIEISVTDESGENIFSIRSCHFEQAQAEEVAP